MRSYILIPALAALNWRTNSVAAASTDNADVLDSLFPSTNSSTASDSLLILPRQYRAEDWASNPHENQGFPYSHGAGKRSLGWDMVVKRMEGDDGLQSHGLMPAGSSRGVCMRGQGTRENKAQGVCSRQGEKVGEGSKGGAGVEGDPRPAKVQESDTHVAQSKETKTGGEVEGAGAKGDPPRPSKAKGGETHAASTTKAGKTAGVKGDPGRVKAQGSKTHIVSTEDKTGAERQGAEGAGVEGESQASKSEGSRTNTKSRKTAGSNSNKMLEDGTRGACTKGGKKTTSGRRDKAQGGCTKEGSPRRRK